jgi:uncharacterized membrane protein YfcA
VGGGGPDDAPGVGVVELVLVGLAAGALNSMGGGGTFVALPALVAAGLPPAAANAASTVALLPGALSGAWAYRRETGPVGPASRTAMTVASALGGLAGAVVLVVAPAASFAAAVPWLLVFATVVLAVGRPLARAVGLDLALPARTLIGGQFVLAVYGGYFGGAVGILMVALWGIGAGLDAATGNPMRVTLLAAINLPAAALFLVASDVLDDPAPTGAVLAGALVGGYVGARVARAAPSWVLRTVVLLTAITSTVLYVARG